MELTFDTETTTFQKGNPFSRRNKACYIAYQDDETRRTVFGIPSEVLGGLQTEINRSGLLIAFNAKFDLHWIRRLGLTWPDNIVIWDVQFAHYLMTSQLHKYPSLDEVCEHWGLPKKVDKVAELWAMGIDTPDIDPKLMEEYTVQDVNLTSLCKDEQADWFSKNPKMYNLFRMHMVDTLVLEEMEWNGTPWDTEESLLRTQRTHDEIQKIETQLKKYSGECPINWDSPDHISSVLYGGIINIVDREVAGVFKTGAKVGETRYKRVVHSYPFRQLVKPLKGSEMAKDGFFKANDTILRQLKHPIAQLLVERGKLSKLLDYYEGYPNLIQEMDWEPNILHGKFNQVVATTGRLSSSEPNLQNPAGEILDLIRSQYV
jgi:DNA polymerase I-like protein with 3'-5' exonuclease and polymerase domains